MSKAEMTFNQLFAGEVDHIVRVPVSGATIKRGDVLEGTVTDGVVAEAFKKATADAKVGNIYVIAAEDVKDYTGEVVAYADGYFDIGQVKINDEKPSDASVLALMANKIYLNHTK